MKQLRYITIQPQLIYYAWQVEVMINNFIRNGINPKSIDVLVAMNIDDRHNIELHIEPWNKLVKNYKDINFYFYDDTRQKPIEYISSIRPNIFKQHLQKYPELKNEVFFYSDCDIIFTKPPDFLDLILDDYWYVSDTNSYINADYILSKGNEVYFKMCDIVGMHESIPVQNNNHSGGAQYIMKNLSYEYWDKVERDSESLFSEITKLNNEIKEKNPNYHELQIWCADMWSVLWNGWLFGNNIRVHEKLNFSWATDPIEFWDKSSIYHNAGVVSGTKTMFQKTEYIKEIPYNFVDNREYSKVFCSYRYVEEIIKTKKISCLI
jgi:hypothetical protein